jgi:putative transposase
MQVPYREYHIVWIPKYRKKNLFARLRSELGAVLRSLAEQKEREILEGHLHTDHVHILISIPPKLSVSSVVGFIKGKSAIFIARTFSGRRRNFVGENFWARGFYVSTVGLDEEVIRNYIKSQDKEDHRLEQLTLT